MFWPLWSWAENMIDGFKTSSTCWPNKVCCIGMIGKWLTSIRKIGLSWSSLLYSNCFGKPPKLTSSALCPTSVKALTGMISKIDFDFSLNVYTGREKKCFWNLSIFSFVTRSPPSPPISLSPGTKIAWVLPLYDVVVLQKIKVKNYMIYLLFVLSLPEIYIPLIGINIFL